MSKKTLARPARGARGGTRRRHLTVLFTCVGRRVELIQAFRGSAERLDIDLTVVGADKSELAPALHLCDRRAVTPTVLDPGYVSALVEVVRSEGADLLIPLIDHELPVLSQARQRFEESGCLALISDPGVVSTCRDKIATYRHLKKHGIDTPRTWLLEAFAKRKSRSFPCFMKPRRGSASFGNYVIHDDEELHTLGRRVPEPIVQELVAGFEHTLDVYTGLDGIPRCVVPRRRLEVRWGEVSKGQVAKDPRLMEIGRRVAQSLPGCRGVITIQCIMSARGRIRVIEINPRFGGGAPLSILAGADLPGWIMRERLGEKPRIRMDGYTDGIRMLRFDQSVFLDRRGELLDGTPVLPPSGRQR